MKESISNNTVACAIFLGEGTQVKLPYGFVSMGHAGAKIKFGTISDYLTFVPSPPPSPIEVHIPCLPSRGCWPNVISPTKFQEDVRTARTSIFDKLTFPKRVVNVKKGEDDEESSFTFIAERERRVVFSRNLRRFQQDSSQWDTQG